MATPVQIEILLHYFYSASEYPRPLSPAHAKAFEDFIKAELLVPATKVDDSRDYRLSEGGEMYIKALMAIPFPQKVTKWEINHD